LIYPNAPFSGIRFLLLGNVGRFIRKKQSRAEIGLPFLSHERCRLLTVIFIIIRMFDSKDYRKEVTDSWANSPPNFEEYLQIVDEKPSRHDCILRKERWTP
jgi:hypothetical protein